MITIYHNSHCSKSREALAAVERFAEERRTPLSVVEYLQTPLTLEQLQALHGMLGGQLRDMVRTGEASYAELGLAQADDADLLAAIAAHPILLQRPIVVYRGRALIARPPADLDAFLAA
jgi:arsenate reductase